MEGSGPYANATFVNCTCDVLATAYTVILNDQRAQFFAQPSVAENVTTYTGLLLSLGKQKRLYKAFRHVEFLYQTQGKQTLLLVEMNHMIHFSE